jgi:hypothetical protein
MRFYRDAGLVLLLFVLPAFSQSATTPEQQQAPAQSAPGENTPSAPIVHRASHQPPCWRIAKISPDLVNQRWHIEDQGQAEIAAVCKDTKTAAKQKQEKIRAIHRETDEEIVKIIPADQLKAFDACQAGRDKDKPKASSAEKELGPCGGVIPKSGESDMGGMHDH